MGRGYEIRCMSCDFRANISEFIEFYVDKKGRIQIYGHPLPVSEEAVEAGIAGFLNDYFCPKCGHVTSIPSFVSEKAHDYLELYSTLLLGKRKIVGVNNVPLICESCGGPLLSKRETYRRLFRFEELVQIGKCNMALVNAILGNNERSEEFYIKAMNLLLEPGFELYPHYDIQEIHFIRSAEVIVLLHKTFGNEKDYRMLLERMFRFNEGMDYRYSAPDIWSLLRLVPELKDLNLILNELVSWMEESVSVYKSWKFQDFIFLAKTLLPFEKKFVKEKLDEFLELEANDELYGLINLAAVRILQDFQSHSQLEQLVERYHGDFTTKQILDTLYVYHLLQVVVNVLEEFGKGKLARQIIQNAWQEILTDLTRKKKKWLYRPKFNTALKYLMKLAIISGEISPKKTLAKHIEDIKNLFGKVSSPRVENFIELFHLVEELLANLKRREIHKNEFINSIRSFFQKHLKTNDLIHFSPQTDEEFFLLSFLSVIEAKFGMIDNAVKQLKELEEYLPRQIKEPSNFLTCPKCKKGTLMLEGTWMS